MTIYDDVRSVLEKYHNIGVMVSGGLDSTVLTYLLLSLKKDNVIELFVVPRPDDSHLHAMRVKAYLDKTFDVNLQLNVVGTGDVHHSKQVTSGIKEAVENYDCDVFLTSTTKNPESLDPPEMLPGYQYGTFLSPEGIPYDGPKRVRSWHEKVFDVFWDYSKRDVVAVLKEKKLDDIAALTHTCTASKTIRCSRCWQCCERAWAFEKNDYKDIGTM